MNFKYKEHIIYWMLSNNNVRLSHYDYSFFTSMMTLFHERKDITENQSSLVTRLLTKYQHQLSVAGLKQKELHALDWQSTIIPSLPEFTSARVKYLKEENLLTIKVPFKKDFINTFRGDSMPYWEWNKEKKRYEATPSTTALKLAYKILPRYFDTIYYGEVKELIDELEKIGIDNTIWNPTLVESNGEYSIAASNDTLDDLLKDTPLNTEPKTLCMLAQLGIAIDEEIIGNDPKMKFCSEYVTQVDIASADSLTEDAFNAALEEIKAQIDSGQIYNVRGNSYLDDLTTGNIIAATAWSGDITVINYESGTDEDPEPFGFVFPESGATLWADEFVVPMGATHRRNVEALIEYYYDPVTQLNLLSG